MNLHWPRPTYLAALVPGCCALMLAAAAHPSGHEPGASSVAPFAFQGDDPLIKTFASAPEATPVASDWACPSGPSEGGLDAADNHSAANAQADARLDEERRAIFDFAATDADGLFTGARFILLDDRFGFLPAPEFLYAPVVSGPSATKLPAPAVRARTFAMIGRIQPVEGAGGSVFEIHASQQGPAGSLFSLDGFLREESGARVLDAVYAVVLRGAEQTGRLRLRLTPRAAQTRRPEPGLSDPVAEGAAVPDVDSDFEDQRPLGSPIGSADAWSEQQQRLWQGGNDAWFRSVVEGHVFLDRPIDLDPVLFSSDETDDIAGIPVPSWLDVSLEGWVDDAKFGPIKAMMMLSGPEQPGQGLSVLLSAEGFPEGPPGSIGLNTAMSDLWQVDAEHGRVKIRLREAQSWAESSLHWTTRYRGEPTTALPEQVEGDLSFDGVALTGRLQAQGHLGIDATQPSRYRVDIEGALRRRGIIEQVLGSVGLRPLTGAWQTDRDEIGTIRLQADGLARRGRFGSDAANVLHGRIEQGVLRLRWAEGEARHGWGLLRPLPGIGLALGIWGTAADRSDGVAFVAAQPVDPRTDRQDAQTLSGEQIDELRSLGRDLAGQGKCAQALALLEVAWCAYQQRLDAGSERPEHEVLGDLVEQSTMIRPMIQCAFDLGLYGRTLSYLDKALDLQHALNPMTRARHGFSSRVARSVAEIRDMAETVGLLEDNIEPMRSPKIGLIFDAKEPGQRLIAGALPAGGAAAGAGVRVGDEILAIDGLATLPMDTDGVLTALKGSVGTPLTLTVRGPQGRRELSLQRRPWNATVASAERAAELDRAMDTLLGSARATQATLRELADAIEQMPGPTGASAEELPAAFARVEARIDATHESLRVQLKRLIALGESLFADWDAYLPTQRYLLYSLGEMVGEPGLAMPAMRPAGADQTATIDILEDRMIARLFTDPNISSIEAGLFYEHWKAVAVTFSSLGQLELQAREVQRASSLAAHDRDDIKAHAGDVARLAEWLERWRSRLALDNTRIAALNAGSDFARRWLATLWALEPKVDGVSDNGAVGVLLAAESVRNRAAQDLFAARGGRASARPADALTSFAHQAPLRLDELVALVRARGGTTLVYFALEDQLLVWVLDAQRLACDCRSAAPIIDGDGDEQDPYMEVLHGLMKIAETPMSDSATGPADCRCQGITARALDLSSAELGAYADAFQDFVGRKRIAREDGSAQAFAELLRTLYQRLVAPIADQLRGDPDGLVTVVPDGRLFQIPFGALLTEPIGDLHYLIEDHPLVYLTSIGMMRFTAENARAAAASGCSDYVTFWDPAQIGYSGLEPFSTTEAERAQLLSLLTRHFPADAPRRVFSGLDAARARVIEMAQRARLLSFVTHARAEDDLAARIGPYIATSGEPLSLADVYGLDLAADLVILAACETGRGQIGSDGVLGLSRAFTFAGAPTLAMSLWRIPRDETLLLLDRFYAAYLQDGMSPARALRSAQLKSVADFPTLPQPNLWAGMVLFGEP